MGNDFDIMEVHRAVLDPDADVPTIAGQLRQLDKIDTAIIDADDLRAVRIEALRRLDALTRADIASALRNR